MIIANAHFSRDIMVLPTTVCCSPPASLSPAAHVRRAATAYLRRASAAYVQRRGRTALHTSHATMIECLPVHL